MSNLSSGPTQLSQNEARLSHARFANLVLKNLKPEVRRAAEALWAAYEKLDIEIVTTLADAEGDVMAVMPVMDGYENEIGELVKELVSDLRANFKGDSEMPLQVRFAHKSQEQSIEPMLPRATGRLVVVPIAQDISLHTTIEGSKA